MKNVTKKLGIRQWHSSSINPSSHGLIERQVRDLSEQIKRYAETDEQIIDLLPILERIQRVSVSKSSNYSAWQIIRGKEPILNFGISDENEDSPSIKTKTQSEYVKWLTNVLNKINQDVAENLKSSRAMQKKD
jgi:hypothetical protein